MKPCRVSCGRRNTRIICSKIVAVYPNKAMKIGAYLDEIKCFRNLKDPERYYTTYLMYQRSYDKRFERFTLRCLASCWRLIAAMRGKRVVFRRNCSPFLSEPCFCLHSDLCRQVIKSDLCWANAKERRLRTTGYLVTQLRIAWILSRYSGSWFLILAGFQAFRFHFPG